MLNKNIKSFVEYIELVDKLIDAKAASKLEITALFRGQSESKPLLPSVAREDNGINTIDLEKKMLYELMRRAAFKVKQFLVDEWEWLVWAQHYGMKTRLLDWTSNPLTALWFACSNVYKLKSDSFVYVLIATEKMILNKLDEPSPFEISNTKVYKPSLNNERIIAQNGWFTSHKYSTRSHKVLPLENVRGMKDLMFEICIPATIKKEILVKLNTMGINNESLFPGISGLCDQINWDFNPSNIYYNKFADKELKLITTKEIKQLTSGITMPNAHK